MNFPEVYSATGMMELIQKIFEHLKEILPDASDKQICKLIG